MIAQERSRAGKRNKRAASASACIMGRSNFRFVNSDVGKGPHPRAQFLLQHPVAYLGPKHLDSSCIQYPYPELGETYHGLPALSTKFVEVNLLRLRFVEVHPGWAGFFACGRLSETSFVRRRHLLGWRCFDRSSASPPASVARLAKGLSAASTFLVASEAIAFRKGVVRLQLVLL